MIPSNMKLTDAYKTNEMNAQKAAELDMAREQMMQQQVVDGTKAVANDAYNAGAQEAVARLLAEAQPMQPAGLADVYGQPVDSYAAKVADVQRQQRERGEPVMGEGYLRNWFIQQEKNKQQGIR